MSSRIAAGNASPRPVLPRLARLSAQLSAQLGSTRSLANWVFVPRPRCFLRRRKQARGDRVRVLRTIQESRMNRGREGRARNTAHCENREWVASRNRRRVACNAIYIERKTWMKRKYARGRFVDKQNYCLIKTSATHRENCKQCTHCVQEDLHQIPGTAPSVFRE